MTPCPRPPAPDSNIRLCPCSLDHWRIGLQPSPTIKRFSDMSGSLTTLVATLLFQICGNVVLQWVLSGTLRELIVTSEQPLRVCEWLVNPTAVSDCGHHRQVAMRSSWKQLFPVRQTKRGLLRVTEAEVPHVVGLLGLEWCPFPLASSGNFTFCAVSWDGREGGGAAAASMDLGAQAGEVDCAIGRSLSLERSHVEDTRFCEVRRDRPQSQRPTGDCHQRNSLLSQSLVLRTREITAGALQTKRRVMGRKQ